MFPSKNMFDYMNEINRLFPRPTENQLPISHTNTLRNSPFNCTIMTNQSSSSADSMSPEVFPNLSPVIRPSMDNRSLAVKHSLSDTPFPTKRHRAIVGRKILGNTDHVAPMFDSPMHLSPVKSIDSEMDLSRTWDNVSQQVTPPNNSMFFEPTNLTPNFYELFPMDNRGYEYKTPVKTSPGSKSNYSVPMSPSSTQSVSPVSSTATHNFPHRPPLYRRNIVSNFGPSSSVSQEGTNEKICTFCRKNGETPLVYMDHTLKETVWNRSIVKCPILRSHVCPTCGATGDDAHTITYCPVLRSSNNGRPLQSTTITLKNTRIKSNGRKRY